MRLQKYPVRLSSDEKSQSGAVVKRGKHSRCEIQGAQMLLWSSEGKPDLEATDLLGVTPLTVATARQRPAAEVRNSEFASAVIRNLNSPHTLGNP